jgi:hypothetical protein
VDEIRNYYGEEIAFYFPWMDFLTEWLLVPGISFGVITLQLRDGTRETLLMKTSIPSCTDSFVLGHTVLSILATRSTQIGLLPWGIYAQLEYENKGYCLRPQFRGRLRKSPIMVGHGNLLLSSLSETNQLRHQRTHFTVMLLGVALCVMILSLNLQGYH